MASFFARRGAASLRLGLVAVALVAACSGSQAGTGATATTGGHGGSGSSTVTSATTAATTSTAGPGGAGGGGPGGTGGQGGAAGGGGPGGTGGQGGGSPLDALLARLRSNLDATIQAEAGTDGWPVHLPQGYLFVSTDPTLTLVAGDHDQWKGTPMNKDAGFNWLVLPVMAGDHYKFTDLSTWAADPWSRAYNYDQNGEISLVAPTDVHLDRWFGIGDAQLQPRTLRVWVPKTAPSRVLYVDDGQNLFDPSAFWGGWHLQDTVPDAMLLVGIDNTSDRINEYTHCTDVIQGQTLGGWGDRYATFLLKTVRPFIKAHYGEPGPVGVMGSSLGGLISMYLADHDPGVYAFAASLSGTLGWGRIGAASHNETVIERYEKHGHQATVLYLDSGGGGTCVDTDGDGINDDDPSNADNYCENAQLHDVLLANGYVDGKDVTYVWQQGATHNEAAWASRVSVPLQIFAGL